MSVNNESLHQQIIIYLIVSMDTHDDNNKEIPIINSKQAYYTA